MSTVKDLTIPNSRIDVGVLVAEPAVDDDYGGVAGIEVGVADGVSIIDFQSLRAGRVTSEVEEKFVRHLKIKLLSKNRIIRINS